MALINIFNRRGNISSKIIVMYLLTIPMLIYELKYIMNYSFIYRMF